MSSTPPGWYPDAQGTVRWWDGNGWTEHVQPPVAPGGGPGPGFGAPLPPAPKKRNTGLIAGIVAGGLVLVAGVVVLVVLLTGGDDDAPEADGSDPSSLVERSESDDEEAAEEASEEPTEDETAEMPELPEPPDVPPVMGELPTYADAQGAPKDAEMTAYCQLETEMETDTDKWAAQQWEKVEVGTPAEMPGDVRAAWERAFDISEYQEGDVELTVDFVIENCY